MIYALVIFMSINSFVTVQTFTSRSGCEFARFKTIEPNRLSCIAINENPVYDYSIESEEEGEEEISSE